MNTPNQNETSLPFHPGARIENNSLIPAVVLGGVGAVAASVFLGGHNSAPTVPQGQEAAYRHTARTLQELPAESFLTKNSVVKISRMTPGEDYAGTNANNGDYIAGQPFHLTVDNRDGKHGTYYVNPSNTYQLPKDTLAANSIQVGSPNALSLGVTPVAYQYDPNAKNLYSGNLEITVPRGEHGDVYALVTTQTPPAHTSHVPEV